MGIWIRSQDKCKLIKCTRFGIDYCSDGICDVIGADCDDVFELGKYKGEEKAIKVLDMIQDHIESNKSEFWNRNHDEEWGGSIVTHSNDVFQMPRDIIIDDDEV